MKDLAEKLKNSTLTESVKSWVIEKTKNYDIVFLGIHGSVLYGLDSDKSDIDFKAVYLPSFNELVLGKNNKPKQFKCPELEVEMEMISLPSFLNSSKSCDTNCIDMLHSNDKNTLVSSDLWKSLVNMRSDLYSKNMKGIVGYIKTHAKKYTNKIDRLLELQEISSIISTLSGDKKVQDVTKMEAFTDQQFKYISVVKSKNEGEHDYLEICGKKYIFTLKINDLKEAVQSAIDSYGTRSQIGANSGIDAKSLSHALRVLYQTKEIIETSDLKFPLKDVQYIRDVKFGVITDVDEVLNKIDDLFDDSMSLLENSDFQEETDISNMQKVVIDHYKQLLFNY